MKSVKGKSRQGFTLAEAMMATVVLSIAAVALTSAFTSGAAVYVEGPRQTLAARLASDMMEEIVNTSFDEIVSTYDGYTEAQGQVRDAEGEVFTDSNYSRFSREAECHYVYVGQQAGQEDPTFILATVKLYYADREIVSITMLIGEYDEDDESTIDFL